MEVPIKKAPGHYGFLPGFHLCDGLYVYNSRDFTTQEQHAIYGWVGLI
jgi:hypothetical protein